MPNEEIRNTGPKQPTISPEELAKALGGEKMSPGETLAFLRKIHGHTGRLEPCKSCGRPHQEGKECSR